MGLTIALVILFISIALHELGHAFALRSLKIPIQEICLLGMPFSWQPTFRFRSRAFPDVPILLRPLSPLGAYVRPAEGSHDIIEKLSYRDKAFYAGAGPLANILFALAIFSFLFTVNGDYAYALGSFGGALALWGFRRPVTAYLLPVIGVAFFLSIFVLLAMFEWYEVLSGPVGVVAITSDMATTVFRGIFFGAYLSLAIGLTNMLPILPLDGGHAMNAFLRLFFGKRHEPVFERLSLAIFLALVIFAFASDFVRISA